MSRLALFLFAVTIAFSGLASAQGEAPVPPSTQECACPVVAGAVSSDVGPLGGPAHFASLFPGPIDSTEVGAVVGVIIFKGRPVPIISPTFSFNRLATITNVNVTALPGDCDIGEIGCDSPQSGCSVRVTFDLTLADTDWVGTKLTVFQDANGTTSPKVTGNTVSLDTGTAVSDCGSFMSGGEHPPGTGTVSWGGAGSWNPWWDLLEVTVECKICMMNWAPAMDY